MWYDIPGFEGYYQITKDGQLRSIPRIVFNGKTNSIRKGVTLKTNINNKGYKYCALSMNGKPKKYLLHRLIAITFIDNPENKPDIDHINGIKTDNSIENLRWSTHKENCNNPKTLLKGETAANFGKKFTIEQRINMSNSRKKRKVICLNNLMIYESIQKAANEMNLNISGLVKNCKNTQKSFGKDIDGNNLTWSYYDDYLKMSKHEIEFKISQSLNSRENSLKNLKPVRY